MTTFIFGDYIYETPIFVIKALKKAEIPEALEQMEKLGKLPAMPEQHEMHIGSRFEMRIRLHFLVRYGGDGIISAPDTE